MAFNGISVAALCREISDRATGGRIYKIAQTESDEIILTIRPEISRGGGQLRLLLSADASLPLCYFTELAKPSPAQAPAFCMLLRKHLSNAKISSISQPGLERILRFRIEHRNEMGDLCFHTLVLELMGKYSNLILLDENEEIVDSIKRVSSMVSSVREVLPGRPYFIPGTQNKRDALTETEPAFYAMLNSEQPPAALLVKSYTGFSGITGEELVFRAGIEHDLCAGEMTREEKDRLWAAFRDLRTALQNGDFQPTVYGVREALPGSADAFRPSAFSPFSLLSVQSAAAPDSSAASRSFDSMSELLEFYYGEKNKFTRIRQRTAELRRTVQTLLERDLHKHELQTKQLKDTEKRDKYRIFGELLNAYGYSIPEGSRSAVLDNYYTGGKLTVPLDPTLSVSANARRYFDRYNKLKRTADALRPLLEDTQAEIAQLQNIQVSLELSADEASLAEIREELEKSGLLHRSRAAKTGKVSRKASQREKTRAPQSRPFHYQSSDGYDIYVGKNNLQNDALTFRLAGGNDIWFHANDMPGSHVILKTNGQKMEEIPDRTFEEAASLAAYYSSGRTQGRVEIDYLLRREVKKPAGSRPGFVIYHSNYSMMAGTDISGIKEILSS